MSGTKPAGKKALSKRLVSNKKTFSEFDIGRFDKGLREGLIKEKEMREKEERERYKSTEEILGKCSPCGGDVVLKTEWRIAVPDSEIRSGGNNPMRRIEECYCLGCGLVYTPRFFKK